MRSTTFRAMNSVFRSALNLESGHLWEVFVKGSRINRISPALRSSLELSQLPSPKKQIPRQFIVVLAHPHQPKHSKYLSARDLRLRFWVWTCRRSGWRLDSSVNSLIPASLSARCWHIFSRLYLPPRIRARQMAIRTPIARTIMPASTSPLRCCGLLLRPSALSSPVACFQPRKTISIC